VLRVTIVRRAVCVWVVDVGDVGGATASAAGRRGDTGAANRSARLDFSPRATIPWAARVTQDMLPL